MKITLLLALAALPVLQGPPARSGGPQAPPEVEVVERAARIAWFGIWEDAVAEAQRSGRPILLMSAAPSCSGVPGMW